MTPKWKAERARIRKLRDDLIVALGNICANWQHGCETPGEGLEIDHVDGCTWEHKRLSWGSRIRRYVREHRAGVRLQILCRRCNGSRNQHTHGTRASRSAERSDPYPHLEEAPF